MQYICLYNRQPQWLPRFFSFSDLSCLIFFENFMITITVCRRISVNAACHFGINKNHPTASNCLTILAHNEIACWMTSTTRGAIEWIQCDWHKAITSHQIEMFGWENFSVLDHSLGRKYRAIGSISMFAYEKALPRELGVSQASSVARRQQRGRLTLQTNTEIWKWTSIKCCGNFVSQGDTANGAFPESTLTVRWKLVPFPTGICCLMKRFRYSMQFHVACYSMLYLTTHRTIGDNDFGNSTGGTLTI